MGIVGTAEYEGTFRNPLEYGWCNKCAKEVHLSYFKTNKNGVYHNNCKKHKSKKTTKTIKRLAE